MSDCPRGDLRDRLPDVLHGTVIGEERAELEAHVAACAACAAELALLREARQALETGPAVDVAAIVGAVRRARQAPARHQQRGATYGVATPTAGRRIWQSHALRIAATVAFLVVGAAGAFVYLGGRTDSAPRLASTLDAGADSLSAGAPDVAPASPGTDLGSTPRMVAQRESSAAAPGARGVPASHGTETVGLLAGASLGDLRDAEIEALMKSLDDLSGIPDAEPSPVLPALTEGV
ncbi:MAG TPA: zf-HC2 domain-containing protein [Gemmatimonadaceae bacterium]|nr:zf-HC2 domain-containing protein [Gemmatimonadaceae bacterium]